MANDLSRRSFFRRAVVAVAALCGIKSAPVLPLEDVSPFYGIKWGEFKVVVLRGEWLRPELWKMGAINEQ